MELINQVTIKADVEKVWEYFTDPDLMKQWLTELKEVKHLQGEPGTPGAISLHVYDMNGKQMEMTEELLEILDYDSVKSKLMHPDMDSFMDAKLEKTREGIKLTVITDLQFKNFFMKISSGLFKKRMQTMQQKSFERLKHIVEEESDN